MQDVPITADELLFFEKSPRALPLYEALVRQMWADFPDMQVKVDKTQITFKARYGFAFVSLRRVKGCPRVFILVTFGLPVRLDSPRVALAVEPYPNRWTHHLAISQPGQIDPELMGWLRQAHDFALSK